MRIAIAGSSGVIGTALAGDLVGRGDDVLRLVRPQSGGKGVHWDPTDGSVDTSSLEALDAVVNLAGRNIGAKRWSEREKRLLWASRVDSTRLLVDALVSLSRPPEVLVNASAVGYYGDGGEVELTEASPPGSGFLADLCVAWEAAAAPAAGAGIRVVRLRSGIVLDKSAGALGRLLAPFGPAWISPFRWGLGGRVGSGRQWWSWISLEDEVGAILHTIDSKAAGPFNLTAPSPVTNRDFTRVLGSVLHRPALVPVPGAVLKAIVGSELAAALVLEGQRALPTALLESGFHFRHPDLEAGLRSVL